MLTQYIEEQIKVLTEIKEYFQRNEKGDAELFVQMFKGRVVYDHSSKEWYVWRGQYWEQDRKREVFEYVMNRVAAEYLQEARNLRALGGEEAAVNSEKFIKRTNSLLAKKRVDNVLFIAQSDPAIALSGDEWDASPDLLPVNNGVIDLRTGKRQDCLPTEYIRAHAPVDWSDAEYVCPIWEKTLQVIFDGDEEMITFIQRLFGYAITGYTTEHKLPIFWGEGRNGKTTILETLSDVLGQDICLTTQADSLMDTRRSGDGPQPFVYALRGKRLAWATESREGQKINLGLIKLLTGGDTLNVRTLHSKPVMFQPTHKIMLLTNHKPSIPADEQAAWDRVFLIPFPMRFVDNPKSENERKQDRTLRQKLRSEYPGILAWLIRGCLAWQDQGLNAPASIQKATEAYRENEDTIRQFIDECCVEGQGHEVKAGELYKCYQAWAANYDLHDMSLKAFGTRMHRRYGEPVKKNTGIHYQGIALSHER